MSYEILSFRACFWSNCVSRLAGANISAPRSWAITQDKIQAVLTHAQSPCLETLLAPWHSDPYYFAWCCVHFRTWRSKTNNTENKNLRTFGIFLLAIFTRYMSVVVLCCGQYINQTVKVKLVGRSFRSPLLVMLFANPQLGTPWPPLTILPYSLKWMK